VTTVVAGLAVVAVALSAAAAIRPDRAPTPGVSPAPTAPPPTNLPTHQPSNDDLGPFKSATITVPTWGSTADATCAKGRITLNASGRYDAGNRPSVDVRAYVVMDVDRDGADDYVAHLACGGDGADPGRDQIVAFRRSGQELVPIGRVVGTQDGFGSMDYLKAADGGRVAVLVSKDPDDGTNSVPRQWRQYAWQGGQFRQVDGPTTFPAQPPKSVLSVAASALPFQRVGNAYAGQLTVTVRNDGAVDVARLELTLVLPGQVQPAGGDWDNCQAGADNGNPVTVLLCSVPGPRANSQISMPFTFVAADKPMPIDTPTDRVNHKLTMRAPQPYEGLVESSIDSVVIPISVP
jgi:hypothetical protein